MTGFSPDWLALRDAADQAARDPGLVDRLAAWCGGRPLRAVDLGCGTGATLRALAPRLPHANWRLIDRDPDLLRLAGETADRLGAAAACACGDLAADVEAAIAGADLVTASAMFDLCSADWVERFVAALPPGAALYAALTYDGREEWRPDPPHEARALAAFHAHQRGDKGFGPALGPEAAGFLTERLEAAGRRVEIARSDWRLAAIDPLIAALADGAAVAVAETGALSDAELGEWRAGRRAAQVALIGHLDVLALPA